MKSAIVLGTRPEIIKMSPIIREYERLGLAYFIVHSGQHYSYNLDHVFFEQLRLPGANYNLNVGSGTHAEQTGKILVGVEKILRKEEPNVTLVLGDTNTVLAGALAAVKLGIDVGHVEAGLRSYDRHMPEEINRVLTDHSSNHLFAPTGKSRDNLLKEGISEKRIFVTGNTIVDAVYQNLELTNAKGNVLEELGLDKGGYFLATVHRQENVDDERRFRGIIKGLEQVQAEFELPLIYPIHPRAVKQLAKFDIELNVIRTVEPLDYLNFLQLESNARLVLTDSGSVQEETCILGIPCVTLRDNTERPETLDVGSNILVGAEPEKIVEGTKMMLGGKACWVNPFGDRKSGQRIVGILRRLYD